MNGFGKKRLQQFKVICLISLGIITAGACASQKGPLPPGSQPQPVATPTAIPPGLHILINQPAPDFTFISTDSIALQSTVLNNDGDPNNLVKWTIYGDAVEHDALGAASVFSPEPFAAPDGRNQQALVYNINCELQKAGYSVDLKQLRMSQDEIDTCRQEYIDIRRWNTKTGQFDAIGYYPPDHDYFSSNVHSAHYSYDELKVSSAYKDIVVAQETIDGIDRLAKTVMATYEINKPFITCCYRNPVKNESLDGSALNSDHMWGMAVDFSVPDFGEDTLAKNWQVICDMAMNETGAKLRENPIHKDGTVHYNYIHLQWAVANEP